MHEKHRTIASISFLFLFLFISIIPVVAQDENAQPQTDEQKMEEVRGYFESEYQEEDYFRADRLLMSATGSMKPVHKAPSVATVITAEDIEKMGALTIEEALETVPGLHVATSFSALEPIYSIRGIHTGVNPQVQMQVNGLPVTFQYQGNRPFFFYMPVETISRIEVIRGPGSAVHGADAFAGVINVVTKGGQEIDGTNVGLRYGSFDTVNTWLQHGASYQGWDVAFNLEYKTSDGDDDRIVKRDLQSALDEPPPLGFGTDASLAPGPLNTDYEGFHGLLSLARNDWSFNFWGFVQDDHGQGIAITQNVDPVSTIDSRLFQADAMYNNDELIQDVDLNVRLNYLYYKFDAFGRMFPPGAILPLDSEGNLASSPPATAWFGLFTDGLFGNPIVTEQQAGIDLTALINRFDQHQVRIATGAKYVEDETDNYKNFGPGVLDTSEFLPIPVPNPINGNLTNLNSNSPYIFMKDQDRTIWYVSLQDEWSFARNWELTAGVRYDHYDDFGGTTNPRLALVWETRPELTTKLLYGSAFRAPAFSEQYLINNPSALGNSDIDPETIDTVELAFDYMPMDDLRFMFNIYKYKIKDLIEYVVDPLPATTRTAQNARDQDGYGCELEGAWQVTRTFQIKGNFAYQHSEDEDTDETIPDAPELQTYLNGHWNFLPHWSLDGQWFWIADRNRAEGDPRSDIDDYSLVNLTLRRRSIANHWDLALMVKNLLDEDISEPSDSRLPDDYPMEERSAFGEVRFYF